MAQEVTSLPSAVFIIWGVTLAIAVLVILPLAIYLLQRTLNAARNIQTYLLQMRDAGVGIASNTSNIPALDDTIKVASKILETAGSMEKNTGIIKTTLVGRAESNGKP